MRLPGRYSGRVIGTETEGALLPETRGRLARCAAGPACGPVIRPAASGWWTLASLAVVAVILIGWRPAVAEAGRYDTVLVSRASGVSGAKGNGPSGHPSISANGRFVAFTSEASNLTPDDPDTIQDVFVRDLWTNRTILVSRATGANGAKGNGATWWPSISGDGRRVAFMSGEASNLGSPADGDSSIRVFVRDLQTHTTTLVSRNSGPAGTPLTSSLPPAISSDGNVVVFTARAPDAERGEGESILARNLLTDVTTTIGGAGFHIGAGYPSVSADGSSVAFLQFVETSVFLAITGDRGLPLSSAFRFGVYDLTAPSISGDGGRVAFQDAVPVFDANGEVLFFREVVSLRDVRAATTSLVSRASGASGEEADGDSGQPSISGDGRSVAFASVASNLTPAEGDGGGNVFVRDLLTASTTLVSRASGPAGAPGSGGEPSISGNGASVAFTSSGNLSPDDSDAASDVYVRGTPNRPPDCRNVRLDPSRLWPPNHSLRRVSATGASDPDSGDSARLVIDAVTQDEPVNPPASGSTETDAKLESPRSSTAWLRAERSGQADGRVYRVHYTATDTNGAKCAGRSTVSVPVDLGTGATAVDSAPPSYNSLLP